MSKFDMENILSDVVLEISISRNWRKLLFDSEYGMKFLIDKTSRHEIPDYIRQYVFEYGLSFAVSKVHERREAFDENQIVFKFESVDCPEFVMYSGN